MGDYTWQVEAVKRFTDKRISAIVAACGTGKTRTYIKLALAKGKPTIIIAPKNICAQVESDIYEIAGSDQQVWRYDQTTETKNREAYKDEFEQWLDAPSEGE